MTRKELRMVLETIKECWSELSALEKDLDDYCVSGHLEEHVEQAIAILEEAIDICDAS